MKLRDYIVVVTPLYKPVPSESEVLSLKHSLAILEKYSRVVIAPETLNLSKYDDIIAGSTILRLEDRHFGSVSTYNRLLLSKDFYRHFSRFEYMLILQPDAIVFRDDLEHWCDYGFDYIGAPWPGGLQIRPYSYRWDHRLNELLPWFNRPNRHFVGNGGLSLRKISSALETLDQHWLVAKLWIANEDTFWSLYSPNVPQETQACRFAIEKDPIGYYQMNGNNLPFGCHAWERYDLEFWSEQFEKFGVPTSICSDLCDENHSAAS